VARIPQDELERLKHEIAVERLAAAYGIELKPHGQNLIGLCPMHADHEPSFVVTPAKNLWHCLGAARTRAGRRADGAELTARASPNPSVKRRLGDVALDLDVLGRGPPSLGEVVSGLEAHPRVRAAAKRQVEADGHFRGDAAPSVDQIVERLARDAEELGGPGHREAERFEAVMLERQTGMGGIPHHGMFSSAVRHLMDQVDVVRVAAFEPEDDSPVARHTDGPKALHVSREGVESKTWEVHLLRHVGFIETGQDARDLIHSGRGQASAVVLIVESLEPSVPEAADHADP
jgi:hypothetical protein